MELPQIFPSRSLELSERTPELLFAGSLQFADQIASSAVVEHIFGYGDQFVPIMPFADGIFEFA